MLKTVDLIKDRINRAGVYEEVQYSKFWILFSFGHSFDYNTNDNSLLIVFEFTTKYQFVVSTTCIHQVYEEVISVSAKITI